MLTAVEEVVDGLAVSAGDDRRRRSESVDPLRQLRLGNSLLLDPCKNLRLGEVRRHHRREGEKPLDQRLDGVGLEQLSTGARDHHRIDDQRYEPAFQKIGDGLDQAGGKEHPGLRRVDADVVEDRLELRGHELRRQLVDRGDPHRVLRRQRDERGQPVTPRRGERLQVGLDAGAAAGIGGGDRQTTWRQNSPFAGITRIRFAGVISALVGTPVRKG